MRSLIVFLYQEAESATFMLLAALGLALLAWLVGLLVMSIRKKGRRLRFAAWCLGAVLALLGAAGFFLYTDALYESHEAGRLARLDSRVRSVSALPVSIADLDVDMKYFAVRMADEPGFTFDAVQPDLAAELERRGLAPDEGESVYVLSRTVDRFFAGPHEFVTGGWLLYVRDKGTIDDGFNIREAVRFTTGGDLPDCGDCPTIYRFFQAHRE